VGIPVPFAIRKKVMEVMQKSYVTMSLPGALEAPLVALEEGLYGGGLANIKITKPIFVVGCHRSGTTVLYEALAKHPDLVFLSNASALLPRIPILSNAVADLFGLDEVEQERFLKDGIPFTPATPSEAIRIWELYAPEGGDYCLDEHFSNPKMEEYLIHTIKKHLKYFNKTRFINKNPDNSVRMRYLNKLFPDAKFINIIRDGRAVCSSLMKVREIAEEFFGSEHRHATSGVKVKAWADIEETWKTDPASSIGLLWKEVVETIERDKEAISPERYLELRFEDFVTEPFNYLEKMVHFCDLGWDAKAESAIREASKTLTMGGRNDAWKKRLKEADVEKLMAIIAPKMRAYGYDV
jgi:Sulfotransferase family